MQPIGRPSNRSHLQRELVALVAVLLGVAACSDSTSRTGPGTCEASARYPNAIGCAYVYGKISDSRGAPMDSIEGIVRLGDACVCSSPRLEGDDNGVFATVVHRLPRSGGYSDTASATVVALASARKYPRHETGAAFFDTSRVVLRFAPIGAVPTPLEVNLRITIPGR